ncbi:uncharacterized protein TM35_000131730 [Trypanosoma theileri]|uniref:BAR domain-containing protein n=1 Tax=Trypanosoma theileri TaxID=67003 RepID=A0A1X0NY72_9TRYP|nr:uncharacterized protein TM35_000131730 [Trypanosoma theileri]ORC89169.1 hypothetical protein TM35_000131730 [Trypanosoma theileri]
MTKTKRFSADSDFEQCMHNAETVKKRLGTLDDSLKRFIIAVSDTATAFECVGNCYVDMATAATVQAGNEEHSAVSRQVNDTRSALYNSARIFAMEMRELKDGQALVNYRSDIHKRIIELLRPLRETAKRTVIAGKTRSDLHKKYRKAVDVVVKKERKYEKKNKPISESKLYKKQEATRDKAYESFVKSNENFVSLYNDLIMNIEKITGQTLDSFVDISSSLLQYMLKTIQGVMEDVTKRYPMMDSVFVSKVRRERSPQEYSPPLQDNNNRSPPTMSSRMKVVDVPNSEPVANGSSVHNHNGNTEPLDYAHQAEEDLYLLNYVDLHTESETRGQSMEQEEQPMTALGPPSASLEVCATSAHEPLRVDSE